MSKNDTTNQTNRHLRKWTLDEPDSGTWGQMDCGHMFTLDAGGADREPDGVLLLLRKPDQGSSAMNDPTNLKPGISPAVKRILLRALEDHRGSLLTSRELAHEDEVYTYDNDITAISAVIGMVQSWIVK